MKWRRAIKWVPSVTEQASPHLFDQQTASPVIGSTIVLFVHAALLEGMTVVNRMARSQSASRIHKPTTQQLRPLHRGLE